METKNVIIIDMCPAPRQELIDAICSRLEQERKKQLTRYLIVSGIFSLVTIGAATYLSIETFREMQASGMTEYMSLVFSDGGTITNNIGDFGLALVESLPVLASALLLSSVVVFLLSARSMSKNVSYIVRLKPSA